MLSTELYQTLCEIIFYFEYMSNITPEWIAIIITLLIAIVGFFKKEIHDFFVKAKVDIEFKILPPNCHKTQLHFNREIQTIDCYYYRLKVKSLNSIAPQKLELMVTKKIIKNGDEFEEDKNFLPMSLVWSHYKISILERISPKLFKFCDFGYIPDPKYSEKITQQYINKAEEGNVVLDMDLEVKPYTGSNIINSGTYRFEMTLSGQNFKEIKKTFEVNIPEYWDESEQKMLNNGLSVKEVK